MTVRPSHGRCVCSHLCHAEADGHRAVWASRGQHSHLPAVQAGDTDLGLELTATVSLQRLGKVCSARGRERGSGSV